MGCEDIKKRSCQEDEDRMIIDHTNPQYDIARKMGGVNRYNGAYYYSKEICERIIPNVVTDYNWITVNVQNYGFDHSIVFVHNNIHPDLYGWLKRYKDLILVCGVPQTVDKMKQYGKAIYLPLSINVAEVEKYKQEKTRDTAYAGRPGKRAGKHLAKDIDYLEGMPREALLSEMAKYKNIYAVGRCAIEAKALGCNILPYDERFPDPSIWKVIDNLEAARMLQEELDEL